MTMADTWEGISPASITGFSAGQADHGSGGVTSGVSGAVATATGGSAPAWSPDNPLFVVAILLALAAGLITVSTHVK